MNDVNGSTTVEKIMVTKEIAEQWLKVNKHDGQRSVYRQVVERYKDDLKNKTWVHCTSPIVFLDDGTLGDGQHRLLAIAETGISQLFTVERNVPVAAFIHIDRGIPRKPKDVLRGAGFDERLAEIANFYWIRLAHKRPNDDGLVEFVREHEKSLMFAMKNGKHNTNKKFPAAVLYALSEMYEKNPTKAMEFATNYRNNTSQMYDGAWHLKKMWDSQNHDIFGDKSGRSLYAYCKIVMDKYLIGELSKHIRYNKQSEVYKD